MRIDHVDLIDSSEVAALVGLNRASSVAVYQCRYPDFPAPLINKSHGKAQLWRRQDVARWVRRRASGATLPT